MLDYVDMLVKISAKKHTVGSISKSVLYIIYIYIYIYIYNKLEIGAHLRTAVIKAKRVLFFQINVSLDIILI